MEVSRRVKLVVLLVLVVAMLAAIAMYSSDEYSLVELILKQKQQFSIRGGSTGTMNGGLKTGDSRNATELAKDCELDKEGNKAALDMIHVAARLPQADRPKILCYVLSEQRLHYKLKYVMETWGRKCSKFFVASDVNDESVGAVKIPNVKHKGWQYLWEKQRETLRYLIQHKITDGYDWVLKADDDSYMIMENLEAYLSSPEIVNLRDKRPLLLGYHGFLVTYPFKNIPDYLQQAWSKQVPNKQWWFTHGGSGYVMNAKFLENIGVLLDTLFCLNQESDFRLGEDYALALCSIWVPNGAPYNTRNSQNQDRFHPETPAFHIAHSGGKVATDSISYHKIKTSEMMHYLDKQLHECRGM